MNENREFKSATHFIICLLWDATHTLVGKYFGKHEGESTLHNGVCEICQDWECEKMIYIWIGIYLIIGSSLTYGIYNERKDVFSKNSEDLAFQFLMWAVLSLPFLLIVVPYFLGVKFGAGVIITAILTGVIIRLTVITTKATKASAEAAEVSAVASVKRVLN
jgi:hypothetical protein